MTSAPKTATLRRRANPRVPVRVRRRWPLSRPSARSQGHQDRSEHRSGYSRSYLPHFDAPYIAQGLTFRLADSVPRSVIDRWREEIDLSEVLQTDDARYQELLRRIAEYEDAGRGECHLKRPEIASLVCGAIVHFDRQRYRLWEWCVMPNHVHVLVKQLPGFLLGDIVRSWKSFTARQANAILGRSGPFWMREYHDRRIRDEKHLNRARVYIRQNPVKAGLCKRPEDWPWSSASWDGGERVSAE